MAKCKYCGKDAGFFSSTHKECERFAKETMEYFTQLAMHAFIHGGDEKELRLALNEAVQRAALTPEQSEQAALAAITRSVETALEDGVVTEEEDEHLVLLTKAFTIPDKTLWELPAWGQLVKSRVLADILDGKTPTDFQATGMTIVLQKGETVIWAFNGVASHETRTRRHFVGSSAGVSVRVMKGVYLRTSAFKGHPVETTERVHADTGAFIITTKHVFFQGAFGVVKMPLKKLASVDPYSDGIGLQLDSASAKPRVFQGLDGWFTYNVITNLHLL